MQHILLNTQEIVDNLKQIKPVGELTELRILGKGIKAGYYTDYDLLAQDAISNQSNGQCYITLNPVNQSLFMRSPNKLKEVNNGFKLTSDNDILRRSWLPIDIDPVRQSGFSSTCVELEYSADLALRVDDYLSSKGFGRGLTALSGNGIHLLYPVNLEPSFRIEPFLRQLSDLFSDRKAKIDVSVGNPSRIWRLYGTIATKGDNSPARPWRKSRILQKGEKTDNSEVLKALIPQKTPPQTIKQGGGFDVESWLKKHNLEVITTKPWSQGGKIWILKECPFNAKLEDKHPEDRASFVAILESGAVAAGCHHDRCRSKTWRDLRELYDGALSVSPGFDGQLTVSNDVKGISKIPWETYKTQAGAIPQATSDNPPLMARIFLNDLKAATGTQYLTSDGARLWVSKEPIFHWVGFEDNELFSLISRYSDSLVLSVNSKGVDSYSKMRINSDKANNVIKFALTNEEIYSRTFFDNPPQGIAFKNGFVKADCPSQILPNSPLNLVKQYYDFDYDPLADCPIWKKDLIKVLKGDNDQDTQDKIMLLQEFFGACLCGMASNQHRCLLLLGGGSNGKSVVLTALKDILFLKEETVSVSPYDWGNDYSLAMLHNKKINVVNELPEGDIINSDKFKSIISGDCVKARSPYERPFTFSPKTGHVFSANELPAVNDHSHGFWRRQIVVRLTHNFTNDPERKNPKELYEIYNIEKQGLINWALEGANRLLQRGEYLIPESSLDAIDGWKRDSDTVARFVSACCDKSNDDTKAISLYRAYRDYCNDGGRKPLHRIKFTKRLMGLGYAKIRKNDGTYIDKLEILNTSDWDI